MTIQIEDVSLADLPAAVIGDQGVATDGAQVPIRLKLLTILAGSKYKPSADHTCMVMVE